MYSSIRTASTSVDVSGHVKLATYMVDAITKKISLTGTDVVEKYYKKLSDSILYRKQDNRTFLVNVNSILYSTQDVTTFNTITTSGLPSTITKLYRFNNYWYAFRTSNGIYRSVDAITWTQVSSAAVSFTEMSYDPISGHLLAYVSGATNFYYSIDNGITWSASAYTIPMTSMSMSFFKGKVCILTYQYSGGYVPYMIILNSVTDASSVGEYVYKYPMTDNILNTLRVSGDGNKLYFYEWNMPGNAAQLSYITTIPAGNWYPTSYAYFGGGFSNPNGEIVTHGASEWIVVANAKAFPSSGTLGDLSLYYAYQAFFCELTNAWYVIGQHMYLFEWHILKSTNLTTWTNVTGDLIGNPSISTQWYTAERTN